MAFHGRLQPAHGKVPGQYLRGETDPPVGWLVRDFKQDPAKLPRIGKKQPTGLHFQQEMGMGILHRIGGGKTQFTGHAQVDSHPSAGLEVKQHLLPVGLGSLQPPSGKELRQLFDATVAKISHMGVDLYRFDGFTQSRIPLFAEIFDFGQLGHFLYLLCRLIRGWQFLVAGFLMPVAGYLSQPCFAMLRRSRSSPRRRGNHKSCRWRQLEMRNWIHEGHEGPQSKS